MLNLNKTKTILTAIVLSIGMMQSVSASEAELTSTSALELLSSEKAEPASEEFREEIVEYAKQFVGNPYVWGGTSLTNGADCSGFVQSVFANFGYELPRVAASQYASATSVSLDEVQLGDLIFYGYGISHVAIYIGDGQIVHAANSSRGIIISDIDYMTPVGAGTYLQ